MCITGVQIEDRYILRGQGSRVGWVRGREEGREGGRERERESFSYSLYSELPGYEGVY
jgi:hypothetical protein